MDVTGDYNTSNGILKVTTSGTYLFEMQITTKVASEDVVYEAYYGNSQNRAVFGFVDKSTNKWVGRFNYEQSTDDRSFYCKGYVNLTAGGKYYFGITSPTSGNTTLISNPTGSTGNGVGTLFALTKIK